MAEPSRTSRMWKHFKEIWTTGEGHYINENGEAVYGKLPRAKVENPIKTICRPTFMNYLFFFVGWVRESGTRTILFERDVRADSI